VLLVAAKKDLIDRLPGVITSPALARVMDIDAFAVGTVPAQLRAGDDTTVALLDLGASVIT